MLIKRILCATALALFAVMSAFAQEVEYRLSSKVQPTFQKIHLKLDPDSPTFTGRTTIYVDISKPVDHIGFYQSALTIESATLVAGDKSTAMKVEAAENDIQHAKTGDRIKASSYQLEITFSGKVNTTSDGVYLSEFEGRNYLFTQFEDMLARKAFPSFDEPSNKIPYQLTISSPEKQMVVSNTPVEQRTVSDGWQSVTFKKTKPMPTYLIAFAVGEMDSAEITGLSVPGRIYTPKGQAGRTKFAIKHTPGILAKLENYFGSKYPYEKLDFVAVPNFTHGAMENVGLVTYRSSLLLLEDEPSLSEQTRPLGVIAHELAHMWYGNLVTMAWWDDLWLNEAFASWMATKVMLDLYPEQNYKSRIVAESAFGTDAEPTTRPIKKQVRVSVDVMDGLGLNYTKGEAILQLMESMVGEAKFQKAVQAYMKEHAWGNAEAGDLWRNLANVADFDVPALMKTYLEQPAYPLVSIAEDGTISQSRYHLAGAQVGEQSWIVPLNLKYKKNGKVSSKVVFLQDKKMTVKELSGADWVFPNVDARGYYRWQTSEKQAQALRADLGELSAREKKSLLYNYEALLSAGKVSLKETMSVLERLAQDDDRSVARAVISTLKGFKYLVDDSNKKAFGSFADKHMMRWFESLGLEEGKQDSDDTVRLRQDVFGLLGEHSSNDKVQAAAQKMADRYLKDTNSMSRNMAINALSAVAKQGDARWFDKFTKAYKATSDANVHGVIQASMRFPNDAEAVKALEFAKMDVGPADIIRVLGSVNRNLEKQDAFYEWLTKNAGVSCFKNAHLCFRNVFEAQY